MDDERIVDLSSVALFMSNLVSHYNNIRFSKTECSDFWDVVILTAGNEEQKVAYELMIQARLKSSTNPLPSFVEYVVVADPPGCKVGNGGSTLHALHELERKYGEKLFSFRCLLLHCGGQSQRLPCTSVLGKIFAPLPTGQPIFEFIDIKLCNYIPFLRHMQPGVFLVSSDDIQPFCLSEMFLPTECSFSKSGFTVLAHPSTLEIGTKHGVYVLPTDQLNDHYASFVPVKRVLQKPTISAMQKANAVIRFDNGEELCYSDSAFFFCHSTSKKLLKFYSEMKPLSCEIDAYGDFLQCLGPLGNSDYVTDQRNVSAVSSTLQNTRMRVYEMLHKEPVNALVLRQSAYVHFGTMPEYINNMVDPDYVLSQANSSKPGLRHFFQPFSPDAKNMSLVDSYLHSSFSCNVPVCVMRSVLGNSVHIEAPCVVIEYCVLTAELTVESECILSQCFWRHSNQYLHVPSGTFLYTLAVRGGRYATVAFGVYDDLKFGAPFNELKYLNGKVKYEKLVGAFDVDNIDEGMLNLWRAKLFTVHKTPDESFSHTVNFVNAALQLDEQDCCHRGVHRIGSKCPENEEYYSIAELLSAKDVSEIIKLRQATIL